MSQNTHIRLIPGLSATVRHEVEQKDSATAWGGYLDVLSSPSLMGRVEVTCMKATDHLLDADQITLGVHFEMNHLSPTPIGKPVDITSTLERVDGKTLTYRFTASDAIGLIASGTHQRAVVSAARFSAKVDSKFSS